MNLLTQPDLAVTAGGWYLSVIAVVGGLDLSDWGKVRDVKKSVDVEAEGRETRAGGVEVGRSLQSKPHEVLAWQRGGWQPVPPGRQ